MTWKKGDLVVVVVVLLVAFGLIGLQAMPAASGNRFLRVELDGEILDEIPINEDGDDTIIVEFPAGEAEVEIVAGRVRVLPMPNDICPLGICSSVGWVERSGDAIVCLPNRLILTVVGGEANELWDSLDGVTK
ncbi:NusG domain II-containing protein [Dethiobacter alkaliphilus]|uniref:NusG domain II-containing protein n=1 Tax=Dethiobacter alkaliphilus TaxID=427926 RepID=UPI0003131825|nr:NusG domain II-containing protein [Dethiobacter alkaliphilus]